MSEHWTFRLGELLESDRPCAFLLPEEIEALAQGRLERRRRAEFERHVTDCRPCAGLLEELAQFETIVTGGGVPSERRSFRDSDSVIRERLGLARQGGNRHIGFALAPALAAVLAILLLLVPTAELPMLIPEIESLRFVPPPSTRGISQHETWQGALEAWNADDFRRRAGTRRAPRRGLRVAALGRRDRRPPRRAGRGHRGPRV